MAVNRCSKCKEDNLESASKCSNCGNSLKDATILESLGKEINMNTYCPFCNEKIKPGVRNCGNCGSFLAKTHIPSNTSDISIRRKSNNIGGGTKIFLYIVTVFLPIVGIIMGVVSKMCNDHEKKDLGNELIILGIATWIIYFIIIMLFLSN